MLSDSIAQHQYKFFKPQSLGDLLNAPGVKITQIQLVHVLFGGKVSPIILLA